MVTGRIALALARFAAQRWANSEQMMREWSAELHQLAVQGERAQMLRFAFSLAVSRPGNPAIERAALGRRLRRTALAVGLLPVAALILWHFKWIGHIVLSEDNPLIISLIGEWSYWLSETAGYVILLALACWLGTFAHRWAGSSVLRSPLLLAIAMALPVVAALLLFIDLYWPVLRLDRAEPELLIWPIGMVATLWLTGRLAQRQKLRSAWAAGIIGSFLTAQLAIMTVLTHITTPVDWGSSPLWLVSYFNYRSAPVNDIVSPTPEIYLMVLPYSLAYVIRAARNIKPSGNCVALPEPSP